MLWSILDALYSHPPRAYHNLTHIGDCLDTFDRFRPLAKNPDLIELALWLHDSIYFPDRKDNEERSAAVAGIFCREFGHARMAGPVSVLILATRHTGDPLSGDAALIADIDMAILAAPAAEYGRYAAAIRAEYSFAPDEDYRRGRAAFIRGLLSRPVIYWTAARNEFEEPARANLGAELAKLTGLPG